MNRKNTVKKQQEFNQIIKKNQKVSSNYFVIYYQKNTLNYSRYGVSVGTKLGNAVVRNSYKRKMRMIIHENQKLHCKCYDFIILLRKKGIGINYHQLKQDFQELIEKLKEI